MYILQSGDTEGIRGLGYEQGYISSIDTVTQASIKFRREKKLIKNICISTEHNTNNTHENGDRCVRTQKRREMRIYVYIQIRMIQNNKDGDREGGQTDRGQTYEQGHAYNKNTVPKICINSQEKKVVMNTKPKTNHAELATQLERKVEKKAFIYDTDSQKQLNRQGMGWGETEASTGKAARLGIHTLHSNYA